MAYTPPTAADLKSRFAEFASLSDATVDVALADAALQVDDSWASQEDFTLGRLLYAAHVLTLDGHGTGAAGLNAYRSIKSGRLSLERAGATSGSANVEPGSIRSTTYGIRFTELQRRNRGGPLLAKAEAS